MRFASLFSRTAESPSPPARLRRRLPRGRHARFERLEDRLLLALDPSGVEQEMLELVNSMRLDPQGHLDVLFTSVSPVLVSPDPSVNTAIAYYNETSAQLLSEWAQLTATTPLAWNEAIYNAAYGHNLQMIAYDQQSHQLPGESSFDVRIENAGYTWSAVAENIYAFTESAFHGHSAFAIDWGVPSRGHRSNLMSADYKEIGISMVAESSPSTSVGPWVVTQDFGAPLYSSNAFLLGVVYDDADENGRYGSTEGLGGVTIEISTATNTYTTTSMTAGGYQLQLPAGTYTVTAYGGRLDGRIVRTGVVVGSSNVKVDFEEGDVLHGSDTLGLQAPTAGAFFLRNSLSAGNADNSFYYGPPGAGWQPVIGDWDGDGIDTVGLYDPTQSAFFLKNTNSAGSADVAFIYGPGGLGWQPIVGDWDNNGIDTVGLYNPTASTFFLRNAHGGGIADLAFVYGPAGLGWQPMVGDWNADGIDTVGLYNPTTSTFFLRNTNDSGVAHSMFAYGPAGLGWQRLAGDWNADGQDTVALYDPTGANFFVKNSLSGGYADQVVNYGPAGLGWTPLVGDWDGPGSPLLAADGLPATDALPALTGAELQPIALEAVAAWGGLGLSPAQLQSLGSVRFVVTDLPGALLGWTEGNTVFLDSNAAGRGWFVDSTPGRNEEFARHADGRLAALDPRAIDRIDLVTVVSHELGHTLGLDDLDAASQALMGDRLPTGIRRLPDLATLDALFASSVT